MVAYLVVNNGNIVFASKDMNKASLLCERRNDIGMMDELDDFDEIAEDLTEEDIERLAFSNGFNGGHHRVVKVTFDAEKEGVFEADNGDEFTYEEIRDALSEHSELDSNFYDTFDEYDFDDEEDDFDDEDEEFED